MKTLILVLIAMWLFPVKAQVDPDVPFVPYTHIQEADFELPRDTCVEEIVVTEATMLHGYCEKDIPKEYNLSRTQAIYMALPPGCMMVLLTNMKMEH